MSFQIVKDKEKSSFNKFCNHPLQAYEWGEFRQKTGITVIRKIDLSKKEGYQLTIHKIPNTPYAIGYLPKGKLPTQQLIEELKLVGKKHKCIFIQLEPSVIRNNELGIKNNENNFDPIIHNSQFTIRPSARPLFTKYTFILDLMKSEDELLKNMHPKTRYNIRVAQKHGVTVTEDNSDLAFQNYLKLSQETTIRQKFYAHSKEYHKLQWETFPHKIENNTLSSHLLIAKYNNIPLVAWVVFIFKDTLYYPYGASSNEYREVMASNLMMWEAIRFGKKLGLEKFDMWGALDPNPDPKDPWYGFHRFKQGYGATLTEFVGSFDLIINPLLYQAYVLTDKLRWMYLKLSK